MIINLIINFINFIPLSVDRSIGTYIGKHLSFFLTAGGIAVDAAVLSLFIE